MTPEERLAELDEDFVGIYEAARRRLLDEQEARALIVVNEDSLLLYRGGGEPQVFSGLRPPPYDKLKTLGHVPLAIFCLLVGRSESDGALPQAALDALQDYRRRLAACGPDLDMTEESEGGLLPRPLDMFERAVAFLDQTLRDGRVSQDDLNAYCRANIPDINATFAAAARRQLDAVHGHMMHLKESVLSADDWESLRVVVMGVHMARQNQNFLQYFSRLLHTPMYADKRVVYYESEDMEGALDLMGTAILDFRAAQAIFDDETRLHRDILADDTTRYLDELFPD